MSAYYLSGADAPLHHFNAVEVECVRDDGEFVEVVSECEILESPVQGARYFWSVYLHFDPEQSDARGTVCVADVPTREAAEVLAIGLETALESVIGARLVRHYTKGQS